MTETATKLLATFEKLPADEQHAVLTQMLRRTRALPESAVSDDELTAIAEDLFLSLDAEEAGGDNPSSR